MQLELTDEEGAARAAHTGRRPKSLEGGNRGLSSHRGWCRSMGNLPPLLDVTCRFGTGRRLSDHRGAGFHRRIRPVPVHPDGGQLTEPKAGARPRRRDHAAFAGPIIKHSQPAVCRVYDLHPGKPGLRASWMEARMTKLASSATFSTITRIGSPSLSTRAWILRLFTCCRRCNPPARCYFPFLADLID